MKRKDKYRFLLLALQPLVDHILFFLMIEASQQTVYFLGWGCSPMTNPQSGGPGYPFCLGHHL